jgi:UDP-glucose 4-epimerase
MKCHPSTCRLIRRALALADVYCLGTGIPTSVINVHQELVRLIGREARVIHVPRRPGDIRTASFNSSRARAELGWISAVSLEHGLRAIVTFLRRQLDQEVAIDSELE